MDAFLEDAEEGSLVEGTGGADDPGAVLVIDEGDGKMLMSPLGESEDESAPFILFYSPTAKTIEGTDVPAGWSDISIQPVRGRKYTKAQLRRAFIAKLKGEHLRDGVDTEWVATPITNVKTYEFGQVTTIAEGYPVAAFAPLNGTVLGVVEGEASLPTIDTDTFYSSLIVDPTALTDAEMDAYLASLDFNSRSVMRKQPVLKKLLQKEPTRDSGGEASIELTHTRGELWEITAYAGVQDGDPLRLEAANVSAIVGEGENLVIKSVFYSTAEFTFEELTVPKGWSEITYDSQSEELTIVPLTQKTTYTVDYEGISVVYFDNVSNQFAPLNGVVFGAQEYSGETLSITGNITNGTLTGATTTVAGAQVSCTIVPENGHVIPEESDIVVTNGVIADYGSDGNFKLMASGNVTITATCPAETPTPSLTPFSVGQTLTNIKFDNSLSIDEVVAILSNLTYTPVGDGVERAMLFSNSEGGGLFAAHENTYDVYAIMAQQRSTTEGLIFFASKDIEGSGVGWLNLNADGTAIYDDIFGEYNTITSVSSDGGWNGILVGAVEGQAPSTYTITTNVTNGTYSGDTEIDDGGTASVTISADAGYDLPSTVSVSGATSSYDDTTGVISLSNPTGNVTISAECPAQAPSLTPFDNATTQNVTGYEFDTTKGSEIETFLSGLTYSQDQGNNVNLVEFSANTAELVAYKNGEGEYALLDQRSGQMPTPIWANFAASSPLVITEGFQNLTDGNKVVFGSTLTTGTVNATQGWNGVFVGATLAPAENNENK